MSDKYDWLLIIAAAALVQGLGKFLDDHHFRPKTKEKMRDYLIMLFEYFDNTKVPNIAHKMISMLTSPQRKFYSLIVTIKAISTSVLGIIIGAVTFFPIGFVISVILQNQNWEILQDLQDTDDVLELLEFAYFSLPFFLIIALLLIPIHIIDFYVGRAAYIIAISSKIKVIRSMSLLIAAVGFTFLPSILLFIVIIENEVQQISFIVALDIIALIIILLCILFSVVKAILYTIRIILLYVFDKATSPSTSPFSYLSALIGVIILAIKFVQEIFT
jgi:hypothetical protein